MTTGNSYYDQWLKEQEAARQRQQAAAQQAAQPPARPGAGSYTPPWMQGKGSQYGSRKQVKMTPSWMQGQQPSVLPSWAPDWMRSAANRLGDWWQRTQSRAYQQAVANQNRMLQNPQLAGMVANYRRYGQITPLPAAGNVPGFPVLPGQLAPWQQYRAYFGLTGYRQATDVRNNPAYWRSAPASTGSFPMNWLSQQAYAERMNRQAAEYAARPVEPLAPLPAETGGAGGDYGGYGGYGWPYPWWGGGGGGGGGGYTPLKEYFNQMTNWMINRPSRGG